ncbi:MAG TPA: TetR family transcriptional regulator [Solirubrobacteraceae bacterium]|jgi:AcrR family transcriptional regulator|nr:TetR family transcriptional regulator [Solirubrobacteraceae bacterium]
MGSRGAAGSRAASGVGLMPVREQLAHGHMQQIQRARLLAATVHVTYELGVANVTVANVVEQAGVSRRTFYELFDDCEQCVLEAIEESLERAGGRVLSAYKAVRGSWSERIRAALLALLGFFDEQPRVARLLVVEWLAAGPRALERRRRTIEQIAGALDEGRTSDSRGSAALPRLTAEGTVGAVASVLHARIARPEAGEPLLELANPLMSIVVLPYLGPAAARRELERALPAKIAEPESGDGTPEDVLKGLKMRLTYRTIRVLAAVAANPGGSNRTIARAAGIGDQGQISKLLMRLSKLGLVENRSVPVKGEANAWALSASGAQVERLLAGS